MAEYKLCEPFDIDDGQLAGMDPVKAFVLGVEWQMVSSLLELDCKISRPVHVENSERIKRMCIRRNRRFDIQPNGEGWLWLEVKGK